MAIGHLLLLVMPDCEASVQEQALALACNLVDGTPNSVEYIFDEGGHILHAIGRQLHNNTKAEVLIQVRSFPPCFDVRGMAYSCTIKNDFPVSTDLHVCCPILI